MQSHNGAQKDDELLGFEMAVRQAACVTYVPVITDLDRQRAGRNVQIGLIHAVNRQARHVPGVNISAACILVKYNID